MTAAAIWSAEQMSDRPRVLILGGTAEAIDFANRAAEKYDVTYSLAGRTRDPALPAGVSVRTGGFGGADAMVRWMAENSVSAITDATHPFAAQIARNTATACRTAGLPRLKLLRSEWQVQSGDNWLNVADITKAASLLPSAGRRAFLSVGRQEISAFAAAENTALVIRSIDPPDNADILPDATFITGRGPFSISDEIALLLDHDIDALVSKNAGGDATYAKIAAARELGITVIMVERPAVPAGGITDSVDTALTWLDTLFS